MCLHENDPVRFHLKPLHASAKRKSRNRFHSEANDAVGSQRIGAHETARILSTRILISDYEATPDTEMSGV